MNKVAIVIPFDYQLYFSKGETVEDKNSLITKHSSFHIQWAKAFSNYKFNTKIFHISSSDSEVKKRVHESGLEMISSPIAFNFKSHKLSFSTEMLKSIGEFNPDLIVIMDFSWPQSFLTTLLFGFKNKLVINRNAGSDLAGDLSSDYFAYKIKDNKLRLEFNLIFIIKYFFYKYKLTTLPLKRLFNQLKMKILFSYSSLVMICSKKDLNYINSYKIINTKVRQLPKPVDIDLFRPMDENACKRELNWSLENNYILHVSNLYDTKGCEIFISILPYLLKRDPTIKFVVVGEGPKKYSIQKLVKKLNLEKQVIFAGRVVHTNLPFYYNASKMIVFLSNRKRGEGRANVLLEAICCFLPILSSNLNVLKNLVEPNFGYCVRHNDVKTLVESFEKIYYGPFCFNEEAALELRNNYSLKNTVSEILKTLDYK